MNIFDIITGSLVPTTQTVKGSIVTVSKNATSVFETTLSNAKVIATYDSGKILGTLQELRKMFVIKNGIATNQIFFIVRVKFSEPIVENSIFSTSKIYNEGWVLAESLDEYKSGAEVKAQQPSNKFAIYSTASGVNVRSSAKIVGATTRITGNNIISVFAKNDLIGYSDLTVTNGFYKVEFVAPLNKKDDNSTHSIGYVSTSYSKAVEPPAAKSTTTTNKNQTTPSGQQSNVEKSAENDTKYNGIQQNNNTQATLQKYSFLLIGGAVVGLIVVIVYAVKKISKNKKTNGTATAIN